MEERPEILLWLAWGVLGFAVVPSFHAAALGLAGEVPECD